MRLINADELIKTLQEREDAPPEWDGAIFKDAFSIAIMDIIAQPSIDAEPVKHGYWEELNVNESTIYVCTCCHATVSGVFASAFRYCPICGARMEGREQ